MLALIIDDEEAICKSLAGVLEDEGWKTVSAFSGKQGIAKLHHVHPDLVFLDVWMKDIDGIETLQRIKELKPDIPVVIMSGHATIDTAVRATKLGSHDFLEKPLSIDKILNIAQHIERSKNSTSGSMNAPGSNTIADQNLLIGESELILQIKRQARVVASKNAWVLITGENGTGKEVLAKLIHHQSLRASKAFVAINCAAIPEELIESELFGFAKGAFTNALNQKKGKFEIANQGTLFLDEIGDMSLKTQAKVLRILQEQEFERLGDNSTIKVDVRVIAATNKNLEEEISQGRFREDLFYRLNVVPFHLPPLRERGDDVLLLAEEFLNVNAAQIGGVKKRLSIEVQQVFREYPWPGNIRELKNLIERLCILSDAEILEMKDLPLVFEKYLKNQVFNSSTLASSFSFSGLASSDTLKNARNEFEKNYIIEKLKENSWNVTKTADAIGVERSNLHRKLKSFDIDPKLLKDDR